MIAARIDGEGKTAILLVLEPGNIAKLEAGQPIYKFLNEFMPGLEERIELCFAYTPDAAWVTEQVLGGKDLLKTIEESMTRTPVFVRPNEAEDMKKVR